MDRSWILRWIANIVVVNNQSARKKLLYYNFIGCSQPGWENATLPFLPSCAKLLYFVDFCVTGSVVLLLCVAAGHGRKLNQGWTLLDWLHEFIQKSGIKWGLCLTSEGTLISLRGCHSPSPKFTPTRPSPPSPTVDANGRSQKCFKILVPVLASRLFKMRTLQQWERRLAIASLVHSSASQRYT